MVGESAFQVEGILVEALPNQTFVVKLSNGHRVLAFATGRAKAKAAALTAGTVVKLQMSPFDLSTGRLVIETK